ncbi:MAG TPA: hypothetical protein VGK58_11990 [Lacipirellulaceae bacterium]
MTRACLTTLLPIVVLSFCSTWVHAQYGAAVVAYDPGATPVTGFTTPAAAIGQPERFTGEGAFLGIVSPFNPPFRANEIVSVGEGGHIVLRLSHYAVPQVAGPEIGVFENVGLVDVNYPIGQAGSPAGPFGPLDSAVVEVSADGAQWVTLGNITFDVPTNGYTDLPDPYWSKPGGVPSDFQKPFLGSLSSFNGLRYSDAGGPDMLETLAGSGGGTWLDISAAGLSQVGFIRFSLADDLDANTRLNFELDAVSIAHGAVGSPVVPEPGTAALCCISLIGLRLQWRRRLPGGAPA